MPTRHPTAPSIRTLLLLVAGMLTLVGCLSFWQLPDPTMDRLGVRGSELGIGRLISAIALLSMGASLLPWRLRSLAAALGAATSIGLLFWLREAAVTSAGWWITGSGLGLMLLISLVPDAWWPPEHGLLGP
ncbi:MAG TPA: hypothetical protein VGE07_10095 [Herpetosiphonaceae bacterium]